MPACYECMFWLLVQWLFLSMWSFLHTATYVSHKFISEISLGEVTFLVNWKASILMCNQDVSFKFKGMTNEDIKPPYLENTSLKV